MIDEAVKNFKQIGTIAIFSLATLMLGQTSAQAGYKESLSKSRLIMDVHHVLA